MGATIPSMVCQLDAACKATLIFDIFGDARALMIPMLLK